jgi:simple sugar transport system ATP-binding protein
VVLRVDKTPAKPGAEVLRLDGLEVADDRGGLSVRGVDLVVRAGEIVGVAGVQGNGQRELVEAVCGMRPVAGGRVRIAGQDATGAPPKRVHDMGVSHIPEDREKHGVVGSWSIAENLVLNRFSAEPFARHGIRDGDEVAKEADRLLRRFDVRAPSIYTHADALSGGNKQKVIVARELSHDTVLVVAAQPTRGVDVGSIEFIHNQLVRARDDGAGVLLVSAELDEVLGLADRVVVMFEGRVVADLPIEEANRERVGLLMAGASEAEAAATG